MRVRAGLIRLMPKGAGILTCSFNKTGIMLFGQERVRQLAEELLQEASHTVHVMEKALREAEVQS